MNSSGDQQHIPSTNYIMMITPIEHEAENWLVPKKSYRLDKTLNLAEDIQVGPPTMSSANLTTPACELTT